MTADMIDMIREAVETIKLLTIREATVLTGCTRTENGFLKLLKRSIKFVRLKGYYLEKAKVHIDVPRNHDYLL